MTKNEFISRLEKKLRKLPESERRERLNFYCEMIEDKIEEGLSESAAVQSVGTVDAIAGEICEHIRADRPQKEKRPLRAWEIVMLVIGSPVWGSILITLASVIFSVLVTVWAVNITLWAVELPFLIFSKYFFRLCKGANLVCLCFSRLIAAGIRRIFTKR